MLFAPKCRLMLITMIRSLAGDIKCLLLLLLLLLQQFRCIRPSMLKMHCWSAACETHHSLKLLSMLLVDLGQAGFMGLTLLPQCILHPVADVILESMNVALQNTQNMSAACTQLCPC